MNPAQTSALSCFILCIMPMLLGIGAFLAMRRLASRQPHMAVDRSLLDDGTKRTVITLDVEDRRHEVAHLEELVEDDRHE
jgi:hypothetical protein